MNKKRLSTQRNSQTGKFQVKKNAGDGTVVVSGSGVRVTGKSTRTAKKKAKSLVQYKSNVKLVARSTRNEAVSGSSVSKKTRAELEKKYKDVSSK